MQRPVSCPIAWAMFDVESRDFRHRELFESGVDEEKLFPPDARTEAERQPVEVDGQVFHVPVGYRHCIQGAPTSPGLCNALVLRMDHRLAGMARKQQLNFTRYADDLTFSGSIDRATARRIRITVENIAREEGFTVNQKKTRPTLFNAQGLSLR